MRKIKAVLFDLDGTLLPMDQEKFMHAYFGLLAEELAPRGYEPKKLISAVWDGTKAMVLNDGSVTNEEAYWNRFCEIFGEDAVKEKDALERFYETRFDAVSASCGHDPSAALTVRALRDMGLRTVLATNPLFPAVATRARMRWAGLSEDDFEFFTAYENSSYTKPNLNYYRMILERLGEAPEDCLMVGNDVDEDMIAEELGMRVFLVQKCLINKKEKDVSVYPRGTFEDLLAFVKGING
ncbi:MAG: HAD family hydrolase [Clostridia bacterium]|nr:HAD family hydrolase [Clostridia bacterium]